MFGYFIAGLNVGFVIANAVFLLNDTSNINSAIAIIICSCGAMVGIGMEK